MINLRRVEDFKGVHPSCSQMWPLTWVDVYLELLIESLHDFVFSRGHATLHLAVSVGR